MAAIDSTPTPTTEQSRYGAIEQIFRRCHEHTIYPPPGDYAGSFDRAGELLEAAINCPVCRNVWSVTFDDIEQLTHMASFYGHILAFEPDGEISWVLTCPRCVMNANDPRARYADYLQSPHWKSTRAAAIERAGGRCQLCNTSGELHVHHRTYRNRGHEEPSDLIALCAGCHKAFHEHRELAS